MIWTGLERLVMYAFNVALNFIPSWTLDFSPYLQAFVDIFKQINWYFPVAETFIVIGLILLVQKIWFGFTLVARIIKLISLGRVEL